MRLILATAFLAFPAHAQQCPTLADAMQTLADKYGEVPRVSGLMSDGRLMVMTAAPDGTWTAMLVTPDGFACMAAAGVSLEVLEPKAPGVDG